MDVAREVTEVLDQILNLRGRSASFTDGTRLVGAIPELDSMAVVSILTAIEERFGFEVADDELDGSTFETFGSLVGYVRGKVDA